MPRTAHPWIADQVRALPHDGKRDELIPGELVATPSPRGAHQMAVVKLALRLAGWVHETGAGELLSSPADIVLGEE